MKTFRIITATILLFAFQATALAAPTPTQALENVDEWLQNGGGIDYLNSQLHQTKAKAHAEWDDTAALYDFTFYSPADQDLYCEFLLSGREKEDNDYKGSCTADETPFTELIENNPEKSPHEMIYRVDLVMHDLVPALLADERAMPLMDSLFSESSSISVTFNLAKNAKNKLMWNVFFSDENGRTMVVKTAADEGSEVDYFTVLSVKS